MVSQAPNPTALALAKGLYPWFLVVDVSVRASPATFRARPPSPPDSGPSLTIPAQILRGLYLKKAFTALWRELPSCTRPRLVKKNNFMAPRGHFARSRGIRNDTYFRITSIQRISTFVVTM